VDEQNPPHGFPTATGSATIAEYQTTIRSIPNAEPSATAPNTMSVKVMSMVWESGLPKNQKMTLLAYADHANDDGTSVYPGETIMSDKTSDSEGNVRRVTKLLLEDGVLVQTKRGYRGQRAEFRINLDQLAAHIARHSAEIAARHGQERRAESAERRALTSGKARGEATPNHQEPSEPSENHQIAQSASQLSKGEYHTAMKNALVEAMGWQVDEIPKEQWGRIEAATKILTTLNADPDEVEYRARVYRVNMAGATMTPNAIAVNWADLATPREPLPARQVKRAAARAQSRAAIATLKESE